MLSKTEVEKLRRELPNGYANMIAEEFNVSKSYVYAIVAGSRINREILRALLKLAKDNKQISQSNIDAIKTL